MSRKLFIIAFCITFILTALLCILSNQPLVFGSNDYSIYRFLPFSILIATLCFLLVYINLPFLRLLKKIIFKQAREEGYYIIFTFIILQCVTLFTGYTESSLSRHIEADMFYYYKGVTNSLIYILAGNLTSIITASLYAKEQVRLKKEIESHKLLLIETQPEQI